MLTTRLSAGALALVTLGCAAAHEDALRADLARVERELREPDAAPSDPPDGALAGYVRLALEGSPAIRAGYERWRAAVHRIAPARRMPDPMVTYAFYALPVQTRVGPQRHRLGVRQAIPWPTALTQAADARGHEARAAQRAFEAEALAVRERVGRAWWAAWSIRRRRAVLDDQLALLASLVDAARARLEIGRGSLADVSQLELARARLADQRAGLDEREVAALAALRAAVGAPADLALPIADEAPIAARPAESLATLTSEARAHPRLEALEARARAHDAAAGAAEAGRFPSFVLGVDWIETGDAATPVPGSGDDALLVSVGVSVPIFGQDAAGEAQRAAEAEGAAARADRRAAEDAAVAALTEAWAGASDASRRLALYDATLLPQAEAALESVTGAYAVGEASLPDVVLAVRAQLEIALDAIEARRDHGERLARLEAIVGRPIALEASR